MIKKQTIATFIFCLIASFMAMHTVNILRLTKSIRQAVDVKRRENIEKFNQILEDSSDCSPPCWLGLHPGRSSISDYEDFVNVAIEAGYYLRDEQQQKDYSLYTWENKNLDLVAFLKFDQDALRYIDIAGADIDDPAFILDAIEAIVTTVFYYEDKGIVILFDGFYTYELEENCKIDPSTQLTLWRLKYIEPGDSYQMLVRAFGNSGRYIQEWTGLDNMAIVGCDELKRK